MRLYRGLKGSHRAEKVAASGLGRGGTDFTDCPVTALRYADGARGVVIVVQIPPADATKVTEELWLGMSARRFMVWGRFDKFIVANIPAKELRAHVRKKGVASAPDSVKSQILKHAIEERVVLPVPQLRRPLSAGQYRLG